MMRVKQMRAHIASSNNRNPFIYVFKFRDCRMCTVNWKRPRLREWGQQVSIVSGLFSSLFLKDLIRICMVRCFFFIVFISMSDLVPTNCSIACFEYI